MLHSDVTAAIDVITREVEGLEAIKATFNDDFVSLVTQITELKGRVIISGMGKSGHIARKIAATLASTGTSAYFVHPGEASHGDLGMISKDDLVILLSNSGETHELKDIIGYCKRFSIPLASLVRRERSLLVEVADFAFILPAIEEASPVNAPTTSTTMMLAWGDALAVAVLKRKGFSKEDFGVYHPGGKLGSQLVKVGALMKKDADIPRISADSMMPDALVEATAKSLGCVVVLDAKDCPVGIVTDGDLRRHVSSDLMELTVTEVMTCDPITIPENALALEALNIMNERTITSLCVVNDAGALVGIVHIHDLLRSGIS